VSILAFMYAQTIKIRFLLVKCLIIRCSAYFELTILISIILKILHTFPKIEKKNQVFEISGPLGHWKMEVKLTKYLSLFTCHQGTFNSSGVPIPQFWHFCLSGTHHPIAHFQKYCQFAAVAKAKIKFLKCLSNTR
jgi:hypothetical protein